MADVKKKAQDMGIKAGRMKKVELIRSIQQMEGNPECFQSGRETCDQMECCWRDECVVSC